MIRLALIAGIIGTLVVACANPLNQVTSDDYTATCEVADRNGQLDVAEQACYRALVNVDWGNLGPEQKSQKLYNLARIKRQLSKFAEAEALLKQSIAIEETLSGPASLKMGRRYVELSADLGGQKKWKEGAEYLAHALPIADQFSEQERGFLKGLLTLYAKQMTVENVPVLADKFSSAAKSM